MLLFNSFLEASFNIELLAKGMLLFKIIVNANGEIQNKSINTF